MTEHPLTASPPSGVFHYVSIRANHAHSPFAQSDPQECSGIALHAYATGYTSQSSPSVGLPQLACGTYNLLTSYLEISPPLRFNIN